MPDHLAHLQHPSVVDADAAWTRHRDGCEQCRAARGPRQACDDGRRLSDERVVAAQDAYRATHPEAFAPERHQETERG
jgi:hypothetical protein